MKPQRWYKFDPRDVISHEILRQLPNRYYGAYLKLEGFCCIWGDLPADLEELAVQCDWIRDDLHAAQADPEPDPKLDPEGNPEGNPKGDPKGNPKGDPKATLTHPNAISFETAWKLLGKLFEPHPETPGRLVAKRLRILAEDQDRRREIAAEAGRRGAAKRKENETLRRQQANQPRPQPHPTPDPKQDPKQDPKGYPKGYPKGDPKGDPKLKESRVQSITETPPNPPQGGAAPTNGNHTTRNGRTLVREVRKTAHKSELLEQIRARQATKMKGAPGQ